MNPRPPFLSALFGAFLPLFPLAAQDQPAESNPSAPLQIQETPVPGTMPAPSTFAPESNATAAPETPAAADAAVPASADPNASSFGAGMGSPGQNPPPSDPNALIPPPVEPEQPSPINTADNEQKLREERKTRYYAAKVKADKEEALASLLSRADKAKSDEAKRQALREYYDLLAKRMKKIDPSISEWIDTMHSAYLRRLAQVRIEPTIPLNPPPTVDASPSPTPAPKKKKLRTSANDGGSEATASAKEEKAEATPAPSPSKKERAKGSPSPSPSLKDSKGDRKKNAPTPTPTS